MRAGNAAMCLRDCILAVALAAGLAPGARSALAAEPTTDSPGASQPRFALGHARLDRAAAPVQSGGPYQLESRLQRSPSALQSGTALQLKATLASTGTACGASGDSIFGNGFE